jgi:hypothetical protein
MQMKDNIRMNLREGWVGRCGLDPSGTRQGPVVGSCKHGIEPEDGHLRTHRRENFKSYMLRNLLVT